MFLELTKLVEIQLAVADRTEVVKASDTIDRSQGPAVRENQATDSAHFPVIV